MLTERGGQHRGEEKVPTMERSSNVQNRAPVRLSLICAWCGREVEGVDAEREMASGRMLLSKGSEKFRLLGGRAVCSGCGGPLFIEDWRPVRELAPISPDLFSEEAGPLETERAA